jgi:hypothetical protein
MQGFRIDETQEQTTPSATGLGLALETNRLLVLHTARDHQARAFGG